MRAPERLEAAREISGGEEIGKMTAQLIMAVVVVDLDGPVHLVDLAIDPRMICFGQRLLSERDADAVENYVDTVGHDFEQAL